MRAKAVALQCRALFAELGIGSDGTDLLEPRPQDGGNSISKEERRARGGLSSAVGTFGYVFVKMNGELWYLLCPVHHENEVWNR